MQDNIKSEFFALLAEKGENFKSRFATAALSNIVKEVITESMPKYDPEDEKSDDLSDAKYTKMIKVAANEISSAIYADEASDSNTVNKGNNFVGSLKDVVDRCATIETERRMDTAVNRVKTGDIDPHTEEGAEALNAIFGAIKFTDNALRNQYKAEIGNILSLEGEDIVEAIGKDVAASIAQTEEKNQIIKITLDTIKKEKEDIQKLGEEEEGDKDETPEEDVVPEEDQDDIEGDDVDEGDDDPEDDISDIDGEDDDEDEPAPDDIESAEAIQKYLDSDKLEFELDNGGNNVDTGDSNVSNPIEVTSVYVPDYETDKFYNKDTGVEALLLKRGLEYYYKDIKLGVENVEPKIDADVLKYAYSNENLLEVLVPASPRKFDEMKLPTSRELASIYAKSQENVKEVLDRKFNNLKAIVDIEQDENLTKKYEKYVKLSNEAFDVARINNTVLFKNGLTPHGVINKNNSTQVFIAKNVVRNLRNKLRYKKPKTEWNRGLEDAINALFDIQLLKDRAKKARNRDEKNYLKHVVTSRENLFYKNVSVIPEGQRETIANLQPLMEVDLSTALSVPSFVSNLKTDLKQTEVKANVPTDVDNHLYNMAKSNVEAVLCKELNNDEDMVVKMLTSGNDASDYVTNVFEKFCIKLGKDALADTKTLTENSAENLRKEAIVRTTIYAVVNSTEMLSKKDLKELNNHLLN